MSHKFAKRYDRIIQIGSIAFHVNPNYPNQQPYRVYSAKGLSPCLNTVGGGKREPKIVVVDETI